MLFMKGRVLAWKIWNWYQKGRLADTRAVMHRVKFYSKEKLEQVDKNTKYKWVIITKEL
jgi:hypothetical protein